MKKPQISLFILSMVVAITGCTSKPEQPTFIVNDLESSIEDSAAKSSKKPVEQLPAAVQQELIQHTMDSAKQSLLAEKRLDIAAVQVDAKEFFAAIVEDSQYSAAVHPDVAGSITLNLKDVTIDEALAVIQDLYGFDIKRAGRVIQVYPSGMRTETIPLNYLFVKRYGTSSTSINSGGVAENDPNSNNNNNGSNRNSGSRSSNNNRGYGNQNGQNSVSGINLYTENESDFWKELKETLVSLVGSDNGRSVIVSPQAGLVTIRAYPNEIKSVRNFINDTQKHLRRQVIIEAKIMEVTLNDDYQQGIKWENVLGSIGSTDLTFSTAGNIIGNTISSAIGGTTSLSIQNTDFNGVIELLQTQGNVQVLSSPRLTATNNQKAVIKVGEDEYFVTDISSTTTTGTSTTVTPEIDLTPFFSGIALDVTPQIDESGEVILHVHPSVTVTQEQLKTVTINQEDVILPLAQSTVRESDTIVRAKSGEIVVIGGLIETRKVDLESKTPLLGDIPLMGELFKSKSQTTQKKELVIMLKPVVIGFDTWQDQLKDARDMLKQWFPDSK
ncbi:pilus (MSHA type) biogenesis protein MshL [Colwellia sp. MEBiC06753]